MKDSQSNMMRKKENNKKIYEAKIWEEGWKNISREKNEKWEAERKCEER